MGTGTQGIRRARNHRYPWPEVAREGLVFPELRES